VREVLVLEMEDDLTKKKFFFGRGFEKKVGGGRRRAPGVVGIVTEKSTPKNRLRFGVHPTDPEGRDHRRPTFFRRLFDKKKFFFGRPGDGSICYAAHAVLFRTLNSSFPVLARTRSSFLMSASASVTCPTWISTSTT